MIYQNKFDCIIVPLPPVIPQLNTHPGIHCAIKEKQHCTTLCTVCTVSSSGLERGSEVKEVDEVLRRERHGATFWVVCSAGMLCVLPEEDVAVCAEVQGVTILLSVRVAAAQLKVHLLPL